MLFNSLGYALFLPLFFAAYWMLSRGPLKWQNALVVFGSYYFYAQWDWRFLSLIVISTLIDYFLSLGISASTSDRKRKLLLWASVIANLGMLGTFKYAGFFVDSWIAMWGEFGVTLEPRSWQLPLVAGISFYTFQTLS
ncbi:MAG: MBOAT family protein, partial [Verrucomicrobiae bacterium]|nr:MBOAT family protein [Verrucomicrobiae bacterium]